MINLTEVQVKWIATAITAAAIFGVGFATGFGLRGEIANAAESKLQAEHSQAMQAVSDAAALAAQQALARQTELSSQIAAIDAAHAEEIERAKIENDRLRGDVLSGARRLSVVAKCPDGARGVPANSSGSGVDHADTRAELDPKAADRIIRIANDGDTAIMQLTACQAFIKAVTQK